MVVISRVGLIAGIPLHLFGEDRLAVDHRAELAVGGAEVEADPIALEMAAQRHRDLFGGRHFLGRGHDHLERLLEHSGPQVLVETARRRWACRPASDTRRWWPARRGRPCSRRAARAATSPGARRRPGSPPPGMLGRQHLGREQRAGPVGLLDADGQRHGAAGGGDLREGAIGQHRGSEIRIEGRGDTRFFVVNHVLCHLFRLEDVGSRKS